MVINPSIERVTCPWCLDSHYGMDDHTPYIHEIFQYPIYQWIGLRDNFSRNAPYFSWENRWFPVYIFPTKPMICSYTIYTFSTSMCQWYVLSTIYPWYTHDIPMIYSIPFFFPFLWNHRWNRHLARGWRPPPMPTGYLGGEKQNSTKIQSGPPNDS